MPASPSARLTPVEMVETKAVLLTGAPPVPDGAATKLSGDRVTPGELGEGCTATAAALALAAALAAGLLIGATDTDAPPPAPACGLASAALDSSAAGGDAGSGDDEAVGGVPVLEVSAGRGTTTTTGGDDEGVVERDALEVLLALVVAVTLPLGLTVDDAEFVGEMLCEAPALRHVIRARLMLPRPGMPALAIACRRTSGRVK